MWGAFVVSEGLNDAFETLGEPTYSRILTATDDDGYILFHLLHYWEYALIEWIEAIPPSNRFTSFVIIINAYAH
jgi:hypothetical protein